MQDPSESSEISTDAMDLLQAVVAPDAPYPWNPEDPDTEFYFQQAEQYSQAATVDLAMIDGHLARLDHLWTNATAAVTAAHERSQASIMSQVSAKLLQMPQEILSQFVQMAIQLRSSDLASDMRLVQVVSPVFQGWSIEDLQVIARPYAYAMRGSNEVSTTEDRSWSELSELEQVRLSLQAAQAILNQLDAETR